MGLVNPECRLSILQASVTFSKITMASYLYLRGRVCLNKLDNFGSVKRGNRIPDLSRLCIV
jgi:hypothetical protein